MSALDLECGSVSQNINKYTKRGIAMKEYKREVGTYHVDKL